MKLQTLLDRTAQRFILYFEVVLATLKLEELATLKYNYKLRGDEVSLYK